MRKKSLISFILLLIVLSAVTIYYVWSSRPVFIGNSEKTDDYYILNFTDMNQSDSHILTLEKDEELTVEYSISKGKMDFTIGMNHDKPIYRGNDIVGGSFKVTAPKGGNYEIKIDAKHAAGSIAITRNMDSE